MSSKKYSLLNDMRFIKIVMVLSLWNTLCADGRSDTNRQLVIVNVGDNATLNCNVVRTDTSNSLNYAILWAKGGDEYIGIKEENDPPYIYSAFTNRGYSVTYEELQPGIFSLKISGVKPDDAGRYKCVDKKQKIYQAFDVSIVSCHCPSPEGRLTDITIDDGVSVKCTMQGYQSPHNGDTAVNITVGRDVVHGNMQDEYLTTNVEAGTLCNNDFLEFRPNPNLPSNMIHCQLPRLDPCPREISPKATLGKTSPSEATSVTTIMTITSIRVLTNPPPPMFKNVPLISGIAVGIVVVIVISLGVYCMCKSRFCRAVRDKSTLRGSPMCDSSGWHSNALD